MQHTLVAVFDNRSDAQSAVDELLAAGFPRAEVRLSEGDASSQTGAPGATPGTADEGVGSSIKHFFSNVFGGDSSEHAQKYSTAIIQGSFVVTVNAPDEPEVERAADIVERFGPVDIDEKAAQWAGGAPIAGAEAMRMSGAGGIQQSQSASLQSQGDRNLFQQQSLNEEAPMGGTYQEPMESGSGLRVPQGASRQDAGILGAGMQGSAQQGSLQRDTTSSTIPVVQEQVKVGKRDVQRGGVRVFSRIVETPVSETIGLREEHVNVERHAVDQPISPGDPTAFREQTIEMRESAEEAVVEKSARVVEEVVVGKAVEEHQQQINATVRHTEVEVERLGGQDYETRYRKHWTSTYGSSGGSFDEYMPAYSHGREMADMYPGRSWEEVEADARSRWESKDKGKSTWEKFKEAVRAGWERFD